QCDFRPRGRRGRRRGRGLNVRASLGTDGTMVRWAPFHLHRNGITEFPMDWHQVEGNWKQFRGQIKEHWGKLTDNDLDMIAGKRDQLEGKIQERYGYEKD